MQNTEITRKWSDIQGLTAVSLDTGKKVGTVEDFYFDPPTNTVRGLLIKTGLLGHRALMAGAITAIGTDAVTFSDENALVKDNSEQLANAFFGRGLVDYRVLSAGGNVVGTVKNIILDVTTPSALRIAAFELAGGLRERFSGRYPTFPASQVTRYGHDVLVISDEVANALHEHE